MKSRLTTWLAALLVVSAVFGVPIARISVERAAIYQVYCERSEARAEQVAENRRPPHPELPEYRAIARDDSTAVPALDRSLFQRPPPAVSSRG